MTTYDIAVLPGDGIGAEVMNAAMEVYVKALKASSMRAVAELSKVRATIHTR